MKVGPSSDPESEMGLLIDKKNVDRVDALVQRAISQGAYVLVRGGPAMESALARGAFLSAHLVGSERSELAHLPRGSVQASGNGRLNGLSATNEFLEYKHIALNAAVERAIGHL